MAQPFPDTPYLRGNFAPVRFEAEALDLVIEGEMPRALDGVLYRNGPNPQHAPRGHHHWFLGDGMVHALFIRDGRVDYRNRWVTTDKFQAERAAGEPLFASGFGAARMPGQAPDPRTEGRRNNVANTNVLFHGGRLLALEEGNPPYELDWRSLEGRGNQTWGGRLNGPMTAHPKIDPHTGEMLAFGYQAMGPGTPHLSFSVIDAAGELVRTEVFAAPYAAMVHDFVTTDRHVVFPLFPATIDVPRILKGGPPVAWDPSQPSAIGIMPRTGSTARDIRWFKGEPCYVFHFMNAHSVTRDGHSLVIADVMKYPRVPLFPNADGTRPRQLGETAENTARLVRWTFDLDGNSDAFVEEPLDDLGAEFPRLDERHAGLAYRHGYYAAIRRPWQPGGPFDTIVHLDLATGGRACWEPGPQDFVIEPVFVPAAADAPEGCGWLLTLVYHADSNRSSLAVLNAEDVAAGPVAWARLDTRIPFGFHGSWKAGAP